MTEVSSPPTDDLRRYGLKLLYFFWVGWLITDILKGEAFEGADLIVFASVLLSLDSLKPSPPVEMISETCEPDAFGLADSVFHAATLLMISSAFWLWYGFDWSSSFSAIGGAILLLFSHRILPMVPWLRD